VLDHCVLDSRDTGAQNPNRGGPQQQSSESFRGFESGWFSQKSSEGWSGKSFSGTLEKPRKTKEIQCRYVINGFLKNTGKHQKKQKTAQQQQQQQHQTCLTTLLSANANAKLHTKFSKVVRIFGKQIYILQEI
jgi:hypothetical protein